MSTKYIVKTIWQNQKAESITLLGGIICGFSLHQNEVFYSRFQEIVVQTFDSSRMSLVISAVAIILGIYIAVISIVATSVLGITKDMLEKRKDKQLLQIIFSGMMVNTFLVFFCVLFDISTAWFGLLLITLLGIAFVSFIKFMCLIFKIFQANFNQQAKSITNEELEKEELITLLKKIEQKLSSK